MDTKRIKEQLTAIEASVRTIRNLMQPVPLTIYVGKEDPLPLEAPEGSTILLEPGGHWGHWEPRFDNVTIKADDGDLRPAITGLKLINRRGIKIDGLFVDSGGILLSDRTHDITIRDCNVTGGGIAIYGDPNANFTANVLVENCIVSGAAGHAIGISGEEQRIADGEIVAPCRIIRGVTIRDCHIRDVSRVTSNQYGDSAGYGIKLLFADECTVENCIIARCAASGINLDGNRYGPEGVDPGEYLKGCNYNTIRHNEVRECEVGINLEVSSWNVVRGNHVHNCGTPSSWYSGIHLLWHSADNVVENNLVETEARGFAMGASDEGSDGNQFIHNIIIATERGIGVGNGTDGTAVTDNTIQATGYPLGLPLPGNGTVESNNNRICGPMRVGQWPVMSIEEWREKTGNDLSTISITQADVEAEKAEWLEEAEE